MQGFEDEYLDVLQNIEYTIVSVYREHDALLDYEVDKVLDALIRAYKMEGGQREFVKPTMSASVEYLYNELHDVCDWRLGRAPDLSPGGEPELKTVEEIIACLKRIRKSIKLWTKEGGRQGYLQFISEHVI